MAATAGARLAEVEGTWLGAVQLVPTVALLAALAAAVEIGLSGWAPGANDSSGSSTRSTPGSHEPPRGPDQRLRAA